MKITAIETHVCHARMRNWIFVKVLTDQPGLVRLGRGDARVAHARRRRRDRGPAPAAHRRGSDADRAPLADDVPPALLARQRHRPRHRDQRHRHRALGHPRQGARRAVPQALGRPGARLRSASTAISAGARWRTSTRAERAAALRASSRPGGRGGLHRVQVDGRAADDAARGPGAGSPSPSAASPRCARRSATRSTSWSTATPGRRPRWGCSSPRRSSRTASTGSRSRAGRSVVGRHRRDPALRADADRDRRAARRRCTRSATCSTSGACSDRPARHHALRRPVGGAADRRAGRGVSASRWRRTTRRARSAPPRRSSSASRRRPTSSARRSRRRALARRGRPGGVHRRHEDGRYVTPSERPGLGDRDRPRRDRAASVPAGDTAAGLLSGRRRRRLVSRRGGAST